MSWIYLVIEKKFLLQLTSELTTELTSNPDSYRDAIQLVSTNRRD